MTEGKRSINRGTLITLANLLIDNIFVTFGVDVHRQEIGIPMGTDPAPFLSNLFLYCKESRWIDKRLLLDEHEKAKLMSNTCRFQDDLYTVNGGHVLTEEWKQIYPPCLELSKENKDDANTHFLDLSITINDGKQCISIYDKRDAFPFDVVSFPDVTGNVSYRRSHSIVLGRLRHVAKGCHQLKHFKARMQALTSRLLKQGFSKAILRHLIFEYFNARPDLKVRYSLEDRDIYGTCFEEDEQKQSSTNG
jgi:hypothetical protein